MPSFKCRLTSQAAQAHITRLVKNIINLIPIKNRIHYKKNQKQTNLSGSTITYHDVSRQIKK